MSYILFSYEKNNYLKYLSLLETKNVIERAFRRVNAKLEYSQGFNPHPYFSFVCPMSVGLNAKKDYFVTKFSDDNFDKLELINELNNNLPVDINILNIKILSSKKDVIPKYSKYTFYISERDADIAEKKYNNEREIIHIKENKKGITKHIDIKKLVKNINKSENGLEALLHSSNESNLNPKIFINLLLDNAEGIKITRDDIFNEGLISLM